MHLLLLVAAIVAATVAFASVFVAQDRSATAECEAKGGLLLKGAARYYCVKLEELR